MTRDRTARIDIVEIMTGLASGDLAWLTTLREHHGDRIAAAVRRILGELGQGHLARDGAEVADIVDEVCFDVLFEKAGSWRPDGGALPWTWADKAIRQLVVARVGHRRADVDEDVLAAIEAPLSRPAPTGATWEATCRIDDRMVLLDRAVRAVTSERDHGVFTEFTAQQLLGDPSPAKTVAEMTGLSAANVRKIAQRVRERLSALIGRDPTYHDLAEIGILKV